MLERPRASKSLNYYNLPFLPFRLALAIPIGHDGYSRCSMYDVNYTQILLNESHVPESSWPTKACQHGWEFNYTTVPYATVATEVRRNKYSWRSFPRPFSPPVYLSFEYISRLPRSLYQDRCSRMYSWTLCPIEFCIALRNQNCSLRGFEREVERKDRKFARSAVIIIIVIYSHEFLPRFSCFEGENISISLNVSNTT